jgi:hypothetical protein
MSDWLHGMPVPWMAAVIFGFTYLLAGIILAAVIRLATKERAASFKAISPGMLPVLGIIFGLFVAFTAAQVWIDNDRAGAAVIHEASALRATMLLAAGLPADQEAHLRRLVRGYVEHATKDEWPLMAHRAASLHAAPTALAEALQFVISLTPQNAGQQVAQREITTALQTALDARRQRIVVSLAQVNPVKWWCLYLQAACALLVIAFVHCDNRLAASLATGLFATGVAVSVLLIAAHDRPFIGQLAVGPAPLLQIMPDEPAGK